MAIAQRRAARSAPTATGIDLNVCSSCGTPFHKDGVIELLQNPVYIGRIVAAGQVAEHAHEPLIDLATWNAVQEIIAERRAKSPSGGRTSVGPIKRQEGLLIDLAYCSNCGERLWYVSTPGHQRYRCSGRASGSSCNARSCQAQRVEDRVIDAVSVLTLPSEWRDQALEQARRLLEQEHPARADRAALEARLRRIARLYEDGLKSETEYTKEVGTIRAQLAATPLSTPIDDLSAVAAVLGNVSELFAEATVEERRAVLVQLVDQVYVRHDALLAIRPTGRAWPLLKAVHERMLPMIGWWTGWASVLPNEPTITELMRDVRAPRPFRIVA